MLGTTRLVTFALRAMVLLAVMAIVWPAVAGGYNGVLVVLARNLLPGDVSVQAIGQLIVFDGDRVGSVVPFQSYALHYGLVLMGVLILAAVGLGFVPRLKWLLGLGSAVFALHVIAVALLGWGLAWAFGSGGSAASGDLVFSVYAVFWGLVPAVIGGWWCLAYWLPRARTRPDSRA